MPVTATHLFYVGGIDPASLPDGSYPGVWGGWSIAFTIGEMQYKARTSVGIRTPAASCTVTIQGGEITVEEAKPGETI